MREPRTARAYGTERLVWYGWELLRLRYCILLVGLMWTPDSSLLFLSQTSTSRKVVCSLEEEQVNLTERWSKSLQEF